MKIRIEQKRSVGIDSFLNGKPEFNYVIDTEKAKIECPMEFETTKDEREAEVWNIFVKNAIKLIGSIDIIQFRKLLHEAHEEFRKKEGYYPYEKF